MRDGRGCSRCRASYVETPARNEKPGPDPDPARTVDQSSIATTARRAEGRCTSRNPASKKVLSTPGCSSSLIAEPVVSGYPSSTRAPAIRACLTAACTSALLTPRRRRPPPHQHAGDRPDPGIGAVLIAPGPGSHAGVADQPAVRRPRLDRTPAHRLAFCIGNQAARTFRPRMARIGLVTQPVREVLLWARHEGLTSGKLVALAPATRSRSANPEHLHQVLPGCPVSRHHVVGRMTHDADYSACRSACETRPNSCGGLRRCRRAGLPVIGRGPSRPRDLAGVEHLEVAGHRQQRASGFLVGASCGGVAALSAGDGFRSPKFERVSETVSTTLREGVLANQNPGILSAADPRLLTW